MPEASPSSISTSIRTTLYESDFYRWTQEQALLLKQGKWQEMDVENIIEEIVSLGKQQQQELENRLGILLAHLLKWQFQPSHRSKSWRSIMREQRRQIQRLLQHNPSLKPYLPEAVYYGYENALDLAVRETSLDYHDFPATCPYTLEQALDDNFLPANVVFDAVFDVDAEEQR
jgi:Domain of unknown function DUF29